MASGFGGREPLVFIGQFRVPGDKVRLAYLFLKEDDRVMDTDPTSGEAVVLIQPDGMVPSFAVIGPRGTRGRSLWRWGHDETEIPVERLVDLAPAPPEMDTAANQHAAWWSYMRGEGPEVDLPSSNEPEDFLGGTPVLPNGRAWDLDDDPWLFPDDAGDMESGHVDDRGLLLAAGNASPPLQAVDAPLDGVALLVFLASELSGARPATR